MSENQTLAEQKTPAQETAVGARKLQEELGAKFNGGRSRAAVDGKVTLDQLKADFVAGKYGGLPMSGDGPMSVIALLRAFEWDVSVALFSRAVPHFPQQFTIVEVQETMARLGFDSTVRFVPPSRLSALDLPAVLVRHNQLSILEFSSGGQLVAKDPTSGDLRPFDASEKQVVASFSAREAPSAQNDNDSWLRRTLARFTTETKQLLWLTAIINSSVLALSFAVMNIFDKVIPGNAYDTLVGICVGVSLFAGIELYFRHVKAQMIGRVTGRIEYLLGTAIFSKLISLSVPMLTNTPISDQISRLKQFETLRDLFAGPFVAIILEIPFLLLFIFFLFIWGGVLGLVPVTLAIFYAVTGILMVGPVRRQAQTASRLRREHYQATLETVSNLRHIHALGCEDVWLERLQQKVIKAAKAKRRSNLAQRFLGRVASAGVPIAGGSTAVIGAFKVIDGELTTGALIGSMILMWRVLAPIQQLFVTMTHVSDMVQTATQIDRMMRLPSEKVSADPKLGGEFQGQIEFHRVSFRYQNSPFMTLQGLDLKINAGEFIAIEGPSGAGKTTVLRLLLDLQRPQAGNIMIDGANIRQISDTELRSSIGYVPQKSSLFHGTIAQNLRFAAPGATDEAIKCVCAELGLKDVIDQMPKGINTVLDHVRQEHLPSGFKQAISIAQALLANPRILLLDEPAKSLDYALDAAFLKALDKRRGTMTIIMVSHRPSHIRLADRVLTLDRGQAVSFEAPQSRGAA